MPNPAVHVLVINWNGREHLDECFRSLLQSTYLDARFVLIDNASTDGSVGFVRDTFGGDPRVEILELAENRGWSGGNNAGILRALNAGADYVLLLNNDTRTDPSCIERLVEDAESDHSIGALAPKLVMFNDAATINSIGLIASTIGAAWDRGIGEPDGPRWDDCVEVIGGCGAGLFLRCETLRKTGLLPEDFGIYLDDLDLCMRVWNADYRIVTCPSAVIAHKFSATMGEGAQARRKYHLNTRNRARIVLRNFPMSRMPLSLCEFDIGEFRAIGRAMINGEWWKIGVHIRTWFELFAYIPMAMRERGVRRRSKMQRCRFWHLMVHRPQFFPGTSKSRHRSQTAQA